MTPASIATRHQNTVFMERLEMKHVVREFVEPKTERTAFNYGKEKFNMSTDNSLL